ncbi:hypothetical protein [Paraburkholderia bengalensis]|uniref:hypothetical protein n=1 Tax=Paraburkholderia bengalensis TaxID=2747562 RepID=UPI0030142949
MQTLCLSTAITNRREPSPSAARKARRGAADEVPGKVTSIVTSDSGGGVEVSTGCARRGSARAQASAGCMVEAPPHGWRRGCSDVPTVAGGVSSRRKSGCVGR